MVERNKRMTVGALQKFILTPQAGTPFPLEDFFVLLAFVTSKTKSFLLAHPEYELSQKEKELLMDLIARRRTHEPVAYLTGQKEFYGRTFKVNKHALIPRPETEVLIEEVLKHLAKKPRPTTLVDLGTGSGAIILTLASELTNEMYSFVGSDISSEAQSVAHENKKQLDCANVTLIKSDLLEHITLGQDENICLIANLPYLPSDMYENTEPDVKNFEPSIALVSGHDGLDHYRKLIGEIDSLNLKNFALFLEIDPGQVQVLKALLFPFATHSFEVIKDLTGRDRFIKLSTK
jgi:release factor glutamine methyltransferase